MTTNKKILLAMLSATTFAMAQTNYIGGGLSLEYVEDLEDNNGIAGELVLGTTFDNMLGAELQISKTFVKAEGEEQGVVVDADVTTLSLFGTYRIEITSEVALVPKVGISYFNTDASASYAGLSASRSDSNTNVSFGLDMKYRMNDTVDMYMGATIFNPEFEGEDFDANHLSIGLQYRF